MKKLVATFLVLTLCAGAYAQDKVREKDLIGEWELIIDVRDEVEDELREERNWFAEKFARAITNFALDIVEEIEIRMDFRENGEVKIMVDAFGTRETEYADWEINSKGELIIEDDWRDRRNRRSRSKRGINVDSDHDVWMMEGNKKLIAFDRGYRGRLEREDNVYMVKRR